jgi:hypothetical protein
LLLKRGICVCGEGVLCDNGRRWMRRGVGRRKEREECGDGVGGDGREETFFLEEKVVSG